MLLLDDFHYMIQDVLMQRLDPANRLMAVTMAISDFDDVSYSLTSQPPGAPNSSVVTVSVAMAGIEQFKQYVDFYLQSKYPGLLLSVPEPNFHVTLQIDLNTATPELITSVAQLKRNIVAAPLSNVFLAVAAGQSLPPLTVPYRPSENMYIIVNPKQQASSEDTITVVFAIQLTDPTDTVIAEVFLKEFSTARKDPDMSNSPSVSYSPGKPPMELNGLSVPSGTGYGYLSFVLFKRHYSGPKAEAILTSLASFRSYLGYHIKCSKGYMHSRMRTRVTSLLQVLQRAVPEKLEPKEKKTASGRTFVRK